MNRFLVCIVGPTAVGKTTLTIHLAQKFKTVIVSADSRQFYKEVSIGTAKPNAAELTAVPHYFINNKSIWETYNAGDFEREAVSFINTYLQDHQLILLCGGSGLYVKAVLEGFDPLPTANELLRKELQQQYAEFGITILQTRLLSLSPTATENIEMHNPQRLMRAIEIATGFTPSDTELLRNFTPIIIGLDMPRESLYDKINLRVDQMMASGLEDEARSMLPYRNTYAMKTVGYAELFDYFDGKLSKENAVAKIKQHSRNYAKKQLTWFRKTTRIKWFLNDETDAIISYIETQIKNYNT
jgi:tRNA dimethylallyltransferase